MADNPDIQWALNLLQPYEEKSVFYKNGTYVVTSILGFSFGAFRNYFRKRPLMSGKQIIVSIFCITKKFAVIL